MIDARELRVGNWVYILSNIQITRGSDIDYAATGADPISLTPEILEKAGFVWVNILHDGTAVYKGKPYLYFKDGIGTISAAAIHIKYLHQLQNLFFALCGKELQIKI